MNCLIFYIYSVSYWLSDKQAVVAVKEKLQQFNDQLVLISDESFVKVIKIILFIKVVNFKLNIIY